MGTLAGAVWHLSVLSGERMTGTYVADDGAAISDTTLTAPKDARPVFSRFNFRKQGRLTNEYNRRF
jgi:hypothetical protein